MCKLRKLILLLGILVALSLTSGAVLAAPPDPFEETPEGVLAEPCPVADPYETMGGGARDDWFNTASTITSAGQPGHTFDRQWDKDWAKFTAQAGVLYVFRTTNLAAETDTVLELYGPDGITRLGYSDDYGGTNASRIDWQAPADGVYYLKVFHHVPSTCGCAISYDLVLEQRRPLDITKTAPNLGLPLSAGQRITYTVTVANNSTDIHTNVVITDRLPMGTGWVQGTGVLAPPLLTYNVGTLNPGESFVWQIVVEVLPGYHEVGGNVAGVQSLVSGQEQPLPWVTAGPVYPYPDADGDGIPDSVECPGGTNCADSDSDGDPDYMDPDSDGDGVSDDQEWGSDVCPVDFNAPDCDTDGDGTPNYLDKDDDGDGIATADEDPNGDGDPTNDDTDGDGVPNYLDADDDGDGIPSADEDPDGDGDPTNDDTDDDGIPNYLDDDDDGDGIPTSEECPSGPLCPDSDGDGIPDYLETDADGDGIPDELEQGDSDGDGIPDYQEPNNQDTDGDGDPDYLDDDDDGDGIPTANECPNGPTCPDSDGDGIPD